MTMMSIISVLVVVVLGDLRMESFSNAAFVGAGIVSNVSSISESSIKPYSSVRWTGSLVVNASLLEVSALTNGEFRCWVGGHLAVDTEMMIGSSEMPVMWGPVINITVQGRFLFRCEYRSFESVGVAELFVQRVGVDPKPFALPRAWTEVEVTSSEESLLSFRNESVQNGGWNTWCYFHMLSAVRLPDTAELRLDLVYGEEELGNVTVFLSPKPALVTPGLHSLNLSAPFASDVTVSQWQGMDCDVRVLGSSEEVASGMVMLVETVGGDCAELKLRARVKTGWGRPSVGRYENEMLRLDLPGLESVEFFATEAATVVNESNYVDFQLADGSKIGFAEGGAKSIVEIEAVVRKGMARVETTLLDVPVYHRDGVAASVSVIGWNTVYSPYYGVFTPVSRSFDTAFGAPANVEGIVFCWDTVFLAQMAATFDPAVGWSNMLAVIRGATAQPANEFGHGFVPNGGAGPIASYDRSEAYVGGMGVLDLWARSSGLEAGLDPMQAEKLLRGNPRAKDYEWAVREMYGQLVGWSDWVANYRTPGISGAVVLGSNIPTNIAATQYMHPGWAHMQFARYEGLDNSPVYDSPPAEYSEDTFHMNVVDVGMSALHIADTLATAAIASLLNDSSTASRLISRASQASQTISTHLYDSKSQRFWDRLYNFTSPQNLTSFIFRDIPPLFYPLLYLNSSTPSTPLLLSSFASALQNPATYNLAPLPTHTLHIPNPSAPNDPSASSSALLAQLYHPTFHDSVTVAHPFSIGSFLAQGYVFVRTEAVALLPPPENQSAIQPYQKPLNDSNTINQGAQDYQAILSKLNLPNPVPLYRWNIRNTNHTLVSTKLPLYYFGGGSVLFGEGTTTKKYSSSPLLCGEGTTTKKYSSSPLLYGEGTTTEKYSSSPLLFGEETTKKYSSSLEFERVGVEGYCLESEPSTLGVALTLWVNDTDFRTCGTAECVSQSVEEGYTQVGTEPICYAFSAKEHPVLAPLPSVARNDPTFSNNYWRGRVWGPMAYLVYQGMWQHRGENMDLDQARRSLLAKSRSTLLTSYSPTAYVFENVNGTTGYGADTINANRYYHWGALLNFINLREAGLITKN